MRDIKRANAIFFLEMHSGQYVINFYVITVNYYVELLVLPNVSNIKCSSVK